MNNYNARGEYHYDGMKLFCAIEKTTLEAIKEFQTSFEDVCLASYPKCGNTWAKQIVCQLYPEVCDNNVSNNINVPFIEANLRLDVKINTPNFKDGLSLLKTRKSPRLMKTHLPSRYFLKQIQSGNLKVIFLIRNVKDMLVSFYYHHKYSPLKFSEDFSFFFQWFKEKALIYGDFFETTDSWLQVSDLPNVLVVRYEDMKDDLLSQIKRIAKFCGRQYSDDELQSVKDKCTFQAMKENLNANNDLDGNLVRNGQVNGWKQYLSKEESDYVDQCVEQYPRYKALYADLLP